MGMEIFIFFLWILVGYGLSGSLATIRFGGSPNFGFSGCNGC